MIASVRAGRPPRVVLSWGLGVDSTAILLRWLTDPGSRDFGLDELVVVVAMTGDEWQRTGTLAETHVLGLLRERQVRLVQVARATRHVGRDGEGVVVLDDSTSPQRLYLDGAYTLSDELLEAGTVAQTGGARLCSVHAKGDALDPTIRRLTAGRTYRHVLGFEVAESKRVLKDRAFDTALRTGEYPLVTWGWGRATAEAFIQQVTGARWRKSACVMCPFSMATRAGLAAVLAEFEADPAAALKPLLIEHVAVALNPRQGMIGGKRLIDAVRRAGLSEVLALHAEDLASREHAVYDVRRIVGQKTTFRSIRQIVTGTRGETLTALRHLGVGQGSAVDTSDGFDRVWMHRRGDQVPTIEHYWAVAPATAPDKARASFQTRWKHLEADLEAGASPVQMELFTGAG